MILAAIIIAKNPAQYGFEIEPTEPLAYDKVRVPKAVDLRRVAEWTQSSIDEIQALNPELRRWTTPVRYPDYEVKVPVGRGAELEVRLASSSQVELASLRWHTVRRGESLAGIARKLGVSRADLAEANNIRTTTRVRVGQQLIIPRAPSAPLLASAPVAPRQGEAPVAVAASRGASTEAERTDGGRIVYRVKAGDTLYRIAASHDVSVAEIKTWNRLRSDRLAVGARLTLHVDRGTRAAQ